VNLLGKVLIGFRFKIPGTFEFLYDCSISFVRVIYEIVIKPFSLVWAQRHFLAVQVQNLVGIPEESEYGFCSMFVCHNEQDALFGNQSAIATFRVVIRNPRIIEKRNALKTFIFQKEAMCDSANELLLFDRVERSIENEGRIETKCPSFLFYSSQERFEFRGRN